MNAREGFSPHRRVRAFGLTVGWLALATSAGLFVQMLRVVERERRASLTVLAEQAGRELAVAIESTVRHAARLTAEAAGTTAEVVRLPDDEAGLVGATRCDGTGRFGASAGEPLPEAGPGRPDFVRLARTAASTGRAAVGEPFSLPDGAARLPLALPVAVSDGGEPGAVVWLADASRLWRPVLERLSGSTFAGASLADRSGRLLAVAGRSLPAAWHPGGADDGSQAGRRWRVIWVPVPGGCGWVMGLARSRDDLILFGVVALAALIGLPAGLRMLRAAPTRAPLDDKAPPSGTSLPGNGTIAGRDGRLRAGYLASLSHEIRTPLNVIMGFAQFLGRDGSLTPQQHRAVESIQRSGDHLLALLNNVLEMARIETGHAVLKNVPFDLSEALRTVQLILRGLAEAKGLAHRAVFDDGLPSYVEADEGKLRQILLNLLDNAVKFTAHGRVDLRVSCKPDNDGRVQLVCEIEDTGSGITAEEQARLFTPFVQMASASRVRGGTGLGLAISQQFARLMGGVIRVRSQPGVGSVFTVELPARMLSSAASTRSGTASGRSVRTLLKTGPTPRILNVDDEPLNRTMVSLLLRRTGFAVQEAVDGPSALESAVSWRPDVMLLDLSMPGMDGLEVLRRLRLSGALHTMRVIVLTAHALGVERQQVIDAGASDLVRKPFRLDDLLHVIAHHVNVRYEYAEARPSAAPTADGGLFGVLSLDVRRRLAKAADEADIDRLEALCAEIEAVAPPQAAVLRALVAAFDYEGIRHRLVESGPSAGEGGADE